MADYKDLVRVRCLSGRSDTNSKVDLLQVKDTENFFVRKTIYGISQPLYQAIFTREVRALQVLNSCTNIVKIISFENMIVTKTEEKVGCIFLEYIIGDTLSKTNVEELSSKDKFSIINQILNAIEFAHSNGIIHRDINPSNIMLTEDNVVKIIDFGICKIKGMVNSATTFQMATNRYSAPEVHDHSENATEQSDLYSIGAIVFYLFTGQNPPLPEEFCNTIDRVSGIDIELKPIIKKLVNYSPTERYSDIFSVRTDLNRVLRRFLSTDYYLNIVVDFEKFRMLKSKHLIPNDAQISVLNSYIEQNYYEVYAYKDEKNNYKLLGLNYTLICIYDENINMFKVIDFTKIVPYERERLKNIYCAINTYINAVDPRFVHRARNNSNLEIRNIIDDYYNEYTSKRNVAAEYNSKYGTWRELLELTQKSIKDNIVRLRYDSYSEKNGILSFILSSDVFLPEKDFDKEQSFVFEKRLTRQTKPIMIGYYESDAYTNDHVVLRIRREQYMEKPPKAGAICLDYRKELMNVQRQLDAIYKLEKEDYYCAFPLKEIITGVESPSSIELSREIKYFNEQLDVSQRAAVKKALNSNSLCIIQGPPGTGKTNVVIEIIRQILKANKRNTDIPEKKVLLVSQSHPAVDKMLEDLNEQTNGTPSLIRIGRDEKLNQQILEKYGINHVKERWISDIRSKCRQYSLPILTQLGISENEFETYYKQIEKQRIDGVKKEEINHSIIESTIAKTSSPTKEKMRKILEIQSLWKKQISQCDEMELYLIKSTTIIAGTCTGFISNRIIRDVYYDYLIIDEAAKATFPELAVSFNKAGKIILVGDHKQLPPVLDTDIIRRNKDKLNTQNLYEGLFEKLYEMFPKESKHRLTVQYRMHPTIGSLISQIFYENEIQNGIPKEKRKIGIEKYENIAIEWISTSSKPEDQRKETRVGRYPEYTFKNNLEINLIKNKLIELDTLSSRKIQVAVITAYSAQKYSLSNMIKQHKFNHIVVEVDTVDAFQGSQKEIIIYSTVRSNKKTTIGFLKSEARLNVAFSRAKSLLIIVGDHLFLNNRKIGNNKFPEIIDYINKTDDCIITEV